MNKISFNGIGQEIVTFMAGDDVACGCTVKVAENLTAASCSDGDIFAGIAVTDAIDGAAAVIIRGYVTVQYADTAPALGYATVASDANGRVKTASGGRGVIVCEIDTANATVGMFI